MEQPERDERQDEEFEAGSANPPSDEFPGEEDARTDFPGVPEEAEDLQNEV